MASLRKRPKSPYWWLKWRNPETGKIEQFSTRHRYGLGRETDKARQLQAEHTLKELSQPHARDESRWDQWVGKFIEHRYTQSRGSFRRYAGAWKRISAYLIENEVLYPRQLRRAHAQNYLTWRLAKGHMNSNKARPISRNTVLTDLKILSVITGECVNRGWLEYNPCHRLGLKKDPPRAKDEMSDHHLALVRSEIARRQASAKTRPEKKLAAFFHISFEIAIAQTLRLSETCFPMADIDFDNCELNLKLKGNKREIKPLNPVLLPLLRRLRDEGRSMTYDPPLIPSLSWFKFFKSLRRRHPGLANISFHSTRVTGISRAERAGVSEAVMMHLANHASTTVHRIYRKVKRSELASAWKALATMQRPTADTLPVPESPDGPPATSAPNAS